MFDTILRSCTVIDGTGSPAFEADIAIAGDKIAAVETLPEYVCAEHVVDCAGMAAAPGFIDIHTHADIALLAEPQHLPKVMQGVTTEVFTNCGLGFAPVTASGLALQKSALQGLFGDSSKVRWDWLTTADLLAAYEKSGAACNVVYLAPHGAMRASAMGMENRPALADERSRMVRMMQQACEEGAWGLSTGLWYSPMRSADRLEIDALCKAAGFFAIHQRDYGEKLFEATRETLDIARAAGVPVQISHLQLNGPGNADRASELIELLEEALAEGIDVSCDVYPYTAGSTLMQALLPERYLEGGPDALMEKLADSGICREIADSLEDGRDWSVYVLSGARSAGFLPQEGMPFSAAARMKGMGIGEWICRALEAEELRACFVHHAQHENNVRTMLQWNRTMIGSDGLHIAGKRHPRLCGTFPRVLGRYVRETGTLELEEAVHKMTGASAARLGLAGRGTLKQGAFADIVVFSAQNVCDEATFEQPDLFPKGIHHVWCNGVQVKKDGMPLYALPGRILRP